MATPTPTRFLPFRTVSQPLTSIYLLLMLSSNLVSFKVSISSGKGNLNDLLEILSASLAVS